MFCLQAPPLPTAKPQVEKREKWRAKYKAKEKPPSEPEEEKRPEFSKKRTDDWIFGDEDFSTTLPNKKEKDLDKLGMMICENYCTLFLLGLFKDMRKCIYSLPFLDIYYYLRQGGIKFATVWVYVFPSVLPSVRLLAGLLIPLF